MYPYLVFWRDAAARTYLGYHMVIAPSLAAAMAVADTNKPAGAAHAEYKLIAHMRRAWFAEGLPYLGMLYTLPNTAVYPTWVALQLAVPLMKPYRVLRFALISAARWQDTEVLADGRWPTPDLETGAVLTYDLAVGLDWLKEWGATPEAFDVKMPLFAPAAEHPSDDLWVRVAERKEG